MPGQIGCLPVPHAGFGPQPDVPARALKADRTWKEGLLTFPFWAVNGGLMAMITLGSGNVVMTPSWRVLGSLEAASGMLMFGVSTAMIFAVIQRLIQTRFADLRG